MSEISTKINPILQSDDIVLFMKGTPDMPACGFSATVAQIFKLLNVSVTGVNILEDEEIRADMKVFSNWPTFPQVYVKGEFVGGCDIIRDMYEEGELKTLLQEKGVL